MLSSPRRQTMLVNLNIKCTLQKQASRPPISYGPMGYYKYAYDTVTPRVWNALAPESNPNQVQKVPSTSTLSNKELDEPSVPSSDTASAPARAVNRAHKLHSHLIWCEHTSQLGTGIPVPASHPVLVAPFEAPERDFEPKAPFQHHSSRHPVNGSTHPWWRMGSFCELNKSNRWYKNTAFPRIVEICQRMKWSYDKINTNQHACHMQLIATRMLCTWMPTLNVQ